MKISAVFAFVVLPWLPLATFAAFELPEQEVLLSDIRDEVVFPALTRAEQEKTLELTHLVYDEIYAHTEMKTAFYANPALDPVPRLRALGAGDTKNLLKALSRITIDLRDLHQSVHWPRPYGCLRSFIPVQLGFFSYVPFDRKIAVRQVLADRLKSKPLKVRMSRVLARLEPGDVVQKIDGQDAWGLLRNAAYYGAGANEDAYLNNGLFALFFHSHAEQPLPLRNGVTLEVMKPDGRVEKIPIPYLARTGWQCEKPAGEDWGAEPQALARPLPTFTRLHPRAAELRRIGLASVVLSKELPGYQISAEPTIGFGHIQRAGKTFGYLRIEEFTPQKEMSLALTEIERILGDFESGTEGLVIDVRSNPGGIYGDNLTQYFSAKQVEPQTEELRASPSMLRLIKDLREADPEDLFAKFVDSMERAIAQGRRFTDRLPIATDQELNGRGRKYTHPVIVLTDPACYSYCDYFSASMQDHEAAEIWIENGRHTGGGGSTLVDYSELVAFAPSVFPPFSAEQNMGIAISTGYRTGSKAGVSIENLGADADRVYWTTHRDLVESDRDLLDALSARLVEMKSASVRD